ncbi:MAG: hypothetical protein IPH43_11325 [Xanthomonadales bacterium]|nr:hypothetical protein [Xanthomonadales bacterium]
MFKATWQAQNYHIQEAAHQQSQHAREWNQRTRLFKPTNPSMKLGSIKLSNYRLSPPRGQD